MSEPAAEQQTDSQGSAVVAELPSSGDLTFATLMDALAPEQSAEEAGTAAGATGATGGSGGAAAPGATGDGATGGAAGAPGGTGATGATGAAAPTAGAPTAGTPEAGAQPGGQGAAADGGDAGATGATGTAVAGGGDLPAGWTADAADVIPKLGELSVKLEEQTELGFREAATTEVRTEYPKYFDALGKHPRLLVGTEVPALGKEGTETLRDSTDAQEWQEAVKQLLVAEVQERVGKRMTENSGYLETLHNSIELFQKNTDLIPGTKSFDRELADKVAAFGKDYEVRVDEKLHGYSIPLQPIINQLRTSLTAERAAKASAAPSPAAGATQQPAPPNPADGPQAGITSKAGDSNEGEEFSTLFGTLGLPNLKI